MALKTAIGIFLTEFSKFESQLVSVALGALTRDLVVIENAASLLDLNARLKLLERLGFARNIPEALMEALRSVSLRARRLHDQRRAVARVLLADAAGAAVQAAMPLARGNEVKTITTRCSRVSHVQTLVPTLSDVLAFGAEAVALQHALRGISEKVGHHRLMLVQCP